MSYQLAAPPKTVTALVQRASALLGRNQKGFAELLGSSIRNVSRWVNGDAHPSREHMIRLARLVHARDPALATQVAAAAGRTLESLGIVPPAPPPRASATELVERVIYAAAEAADLSPRAVRPALVAAFRRAHQTRLTLEEALAALEAPPPDGAR